MPDTYFEPQEENTSTPQDNKPVTPPKVKSQTRVTKPRVKPLVEGINAPARVTSNVMPPRTPNPPPDPSARAGLTDAEEKLISETSDTRPQPQRLMPQSTFGGSGKSSRGGKGWLAVLLFIIIIIVLAYGWLGWQGGSYNPKAIIGYFTSGKTVSQTSPAEQTPVTSSLPVQPRNEVPPAATTTPTSTPAATTTPVIPPTLKLKVSATPNGFLNVRSQPSQSAKIITKVHPGETYTYTQVQGGWYNITLPDGQTGWVSGQYVVTQ